MTATGCSAAGPLRNNPAVRRPDMKPMACASLAANTASTPGRFASATTLPEALRSRIEPARRFHAGLQRGVLEAVPAPRRARVVAADESEILAALRNEMPRDRDAGFVIVKSGHRVDRLRRKLPGLDDRNAGAPQQPRAVCRSRASRP